MVRAKCILTRSNATSQAKFQKYLNKKSPITGYGLHSKFNLKDAAKYSRSWGKVYKMFGRGFG